MRTHLDEISTLRIAVTGHRDLETVQEADIRSLVRAAIDQTIEDCSPGSVEFITGMADGADQLAAEVALSLGCHLRLALPRQLAEYRGELTHESQRRLDEYASLDDVRVTVIGGSSGSTDDGESAATVYQDLGNYIARSAHLLIALWDGGSEVKPGGTLDVLTTYLDGRNRPDPQSARPPVLEPCDPTEALPGPTAIWIRVGRESSTTSPSPATMFLVGSGIPGVWRTSNSTPSGHTAMLEALADAATVSAETKDEPSGYPLVDELPSDLDSSRQDALEQIHSAYLAADGLAVRHQARSDRAFRGTSLIAASMGFAFLWFAKIDDHLAWLYIYLVFFLAGYLLFRVARSRRWLRHHLSMRVLAETLRVRFFTTMLGIADQVDIRRVLTLTGVSSFPGFEWAAEADRIGVPTHQAGSQADVSHADFVRTTWIDDQAGYFERKVQQLHARHERLERIQQMLYVLSFLAAVLIVTYGSELKKSYAPGHVSAKTIVIFLMGLLPLWLTFWELHQGRMATRELLWQFRNQATIFKRAADDLDATRADAADTRRRVYLELAERSLFETYLWTIHRFHREFTPPSGG